MREYIRYFRWLFLCIAVLALVLIGIEGGHASRAKARYYERTNEACRTDQRVFDYADVLSTEEEKELEELIAKRERQVQCDIVLVTLEESLKEYAREKEPSVSYDQFVRVYAEAFYEENGFGYNQPNGDGVLLVDNWYLEDDGRIYTWLCTTGIVKDAYSDEDVDHILDRVYRDIEKDPYRAYQTYINDFYDDMLGSRMFHADVPRALPLIIGIIAAVIFIPLNWKSRSGSNTTTAKTYVSGGKEQFVNKQDLFIRKSVVKRHIETSSGNSSGGGSSSGGGGGGSHGGGGHSR